MLPTRPRSSERSRCNSCTAPFSTTATRVSCGVQLMRMSCMQRPGSEGDVGLAQEPRGVVQRQTHDTGVAALDALNPRRGTALDRIGARLAERLAAGDVGVDLGPCD